MLPTHSWPGNAARQPIRNKKHAGLWLRTAPGPKLGSDSEHGNTHTHTHTLTLIFSAMISGSSHIDSTKKTCVGETRSWSRGVLGFFFQVFIRNKRKTHLVSVLFGKAEDDLSALCRRVGGIKNLQRRVRVMNAQIKKNTWRSYWHHDYGDTTFEVFKQLFQWDFSFIIVFTYC